MEYSKTENKEFELNLNLLKRQTPIEFGHMLPYFKKTRSFFCNKTSKK